jgi:hypothetical protein
MESPIQIKGQLLYHILVIVKWFLVKKKKKRDQNLFDYKMRWLAVKSIFHLHEIYTSSVCV